MSKDRDLQIALEEILERVIDVTAADFGNLQVVVQRDRSLRIAAHRGFDARFLTFFRIVKHDMSACASALKHSKRVVIRDVRRSRLFTESARRELLKAGVHGVQSTPVCTSEGKVLAMVSTHFRAPHVPTRGQLRRVDVLARHAADVIESAGTSSRVDARKTIEELHDSTVAKARFVRPSAKAS
jgi:hypothetical protein